MLIKAKWRGEEVYITLDGEIDEHSAAEARRVADKIAEKSAGATRVIFDLQKVTFMDSTGIGFLIGRYKSFRRYGVPMYITSPNLSADKILAMSGVYTLIPRV
ncbi:MAG: STAS domain-containing protein [Clostridia bacterium]|nr:STAS domain-containing protein [Clostridia bacterium]